MTNQNQRIVFISYSHVDTDFVNRFASLLLNLDIQIWKDSKDIKVGGAILESVYEGMKNTSHFCCIISLSSVKSTWVKEELSFAKHRRLEGSDLAIVPVLIDEVEIPDYIKVYRCAHLENRNLSTENPEVIMLLRAFGIDIQGEGPRIITGVRRQLLLNAGVELQERIIHFRKKLGTFQTDYRAYQRARLASKHIRVLDNSPSRRGIGARSRKGSGYRYVLNPEYFKIKSARDRARSALIDLRESASWLKEPISTFKRALTIAEINTSGSEARDSSSVKVLWGSLDDALDRLSEMSKIICKISREEAHEDDEKKEDPDWEREDGWDQMTGLWWTGEKLPRWIAQIPRIEAELESVTGMLVYWRRFESKK